MKNAKLSEFSEDRHAICPGLLIMRDDMNQNYNLKDGVVIHRLGYVRFRQFIRKTSTRPPFKGLRLSFIHEGKEHLRRWEGWYGEKTIARLANEFITEIKGGAI